MLYYYISRSYVINIKMHVSWRLNRDVSSPYPDALTLPSKPMYNVQTVNSKFPVTVGFPRIPKEPKNSKSFQKTKKNQEYVQLCPISVSKCNVQVQCPITVSKYDVQVQSLINLRKGVLRSSKTNHITYI